MCGFGPVDIIFVAGRTFPPSQAPSAHFSPVLPWTGFLHFMRLTFLFRFFGGNFLSALEATSALSISWGGPGHTFVGRFFPVQFLVLRA